MEQQKKDNRGALWTNAKKSADKHPDYTGSITVAGVDYWLSMWVSQNRTSDKSPVMTLTVKPKQASGATPVSTQPVSAHNEAKADGYQRQPGDEADDSIPF